MDAFVNPITADYEITEGMLERDPAAGLANAVYIRLMTPLGSWWQNAQLGSRLHELQREKDVPRISVLAKEYCESALKPIIDDGRALSIEVSTEQTHNGRLNLLIEVTETSGEKRTFKHQVKVS